MIKVKLRGFAVDAHGNEQEVDVFLDIEEQSSDMGRVNVYGHMDIWRASFVPLPPFDPYITAATIAAQSSSQEKP